MRQRPRIDAFTLIETLAASLLISILMVSVLQVTSGLGRTQSALSRRNYPTDDDGTIALLRWDFANANRVSPGEGSFSLDGHCALNPTTLEAAHQSVSVTYRLANEGPENWLVREQADRASGRRWTAPVCAGLSTISLSPAPGLDSYHVVIRWTNPNRLPINLTFSNR